jgi:hypothetical protein
LSKWHTIKGITRPLNVPITVVLPNHLRELTGKGLHSNIHLKDSMTSMTNMRKTIMDIMITAMVMGKATMISTSSQAMAEELVHVGSIHRRTKATLHSKDTMTMAGPEVAEIRDRKGVPAEGEAAIMGDHRQRIVVEVEVEEATLMVMARP